MPTLGFLKKKRTKESSGKDGAPLTPTTSNISQFSATPTTPTTPKTPKTPNTNFDSSISTTTTTDTQPISISTATTLSTDSKQPNSFNSNKQPSMTQGAQYEQYTPHTEKTNVAKQENVLPSISNLIHPPQHDGASQTYPSPMAAQPNQAVADNSGTVTPQPTQVRTTKGKYTLEDFEIRRTLGTGSFGRVHLVQSKHNQRFYAVKVLKKTQVVKMKQVEHTNDERRMLQEVKHPFLITLWGTFQDSKNIYMVMDFVEGGELFSLLRKSQVF
jgi:protein kinase A